MRLRNIPGADEAILNSEYCIKEPESKKGNWQSVFSSTQPLHIEIGMGKGRFIMDMAGEWTTKSTESASASSSEQTKTEETEQEYEQDVLLASPVIVVYGK